MKRKLSHPRLLLAARHAQYTTEVTRKAIPPQMDHLGICKTLHTFPPAHLYFQSCSGSQGDIIPVNSDTTSMAF